MFVGPKFHHIGYSLKAIHHCNHLGLHILLPLVGLICLLFLSQTPFRFKPLALIIFLFRCHSLFLIGGALRRGWGLFSRYFCLLNFMFQDLKNTISVRLQSHINNLTCQKLYISIERNAISTHCFVFSVSAHPV